MTLDDFEKAVGEFKVATPMNWLLSQAEFAVKRFGPDFGAPKEPADVDAVLVFRGQLPNGRWIQWARAIYTAQVEAMLGKEPAEKLLRACAEEVGQSLMAGSMERNGERPWMPKAWRNEFQYDPLDLSADW